MDVLVVDGYNIIGAWDELIKLKIKEIELARNRLIELLMEYQAFTGMRVIVVFDALYVKGVESRKQVNNLEIIYTREDETADECIERLIKLLKNVKNQVYVATSDYVEQKITFGRGALRISARELQIEMSDIEANISDQLEIQNKLRPSTRIPMDEEVLKRFEKWRRGNI